jgi:hypothetical protein
VIYLFFPERIQSIKETDKVLEVGPGSSPFSRSDVLLDKKFNDKEVLEQRGLQPKIEYNKPIYYYDGSKFPFKDDEFDYVICSQVIEHIPKNEFANFIKEIERVAKRGYIEVPRLFYEYIFNFHVHCWLINFKDGKLLLLDKKKIKFSHIQDVFYLMLRYGGKNKKITLINDFVDLFMIGYEWRNRINYEIVDNLDELISSEDVAFYKEYFIRLDEKTAGVNSRKSITERIFRKILSYFKVLK